MSKKRILVTGASGFIGSELIKRLGEEDVLVYGLYCNTEPQIGDGYRPKNCDFIKCDLTGEKDEVFGHTNKRLFPGEYMNEKYHSLEKIMISVQPNIVIHLGGASSPGADNFIINNILGTQRLCQCCHSAILENVELFINASSVVVYDDEMMENNLTMFEEHQTRPISLYGATKLAGEHIVNLPQWNIDYVCNLRMCAVVGDVDTLTHGAIKHLTNKIIEAKKNGTNEIEAYGKYPGSTKPYIHVDDVCNYITAIVKQEAELWPVVNVSADNSISIAEVIKTINEEIGGEEVKVNWLEDRVPVGDNNKIFVGNGTFRKDSGKTHCSYTAIRKSVRSSLNENSNTPK